MAFPAHTQSLADGFVTALRTATRLKAYATEIRDFSEVEYTSANQIIQLYARLVEAKVLFASVADLPGIAAYAQEQLGDDQLDIAAEFLAMTAQIENCRQWVLSNFPNYNGYILKDTLDSTGIVVRNFSPAELSSLRTVLDTLITTID